MSPGIFEFPKGYMFISKSFILVVKFEEKKPIEAQLLKSVVFLTEIKALLFLT